MFGLGREMRRLGEQRIRRTFASGERLIQKDSFAEQRGKTERAKAHPGAVQELATGQKMIRKLGGVFLLILVVGVHRLNNTDTDGGDEPLVSKLFADKTKMMKIKNLRGECQHCGGLIEFHAEHAGTIGECPHCNQNTQLMLALPPEDASPLRRKVIIFSLIGSLIFIGGLIGMKTALNRARQLRAENEKFSSSSISQSTTRTEDVFAKDGFYISQPSISKSEGSTIMHAVGSVTNVAKHQRYGVKVELEIFDLSGEKIGVTSDYKKIMESGAEWRYRALIVEKRAASAKILRVTESN